MIPIKIVASNLELPPKISTQIKNSEITFRFRLPGT
jgi:hypothetical protein